MLISETFQVMAGLLLAHRPSKKNASRTRIEPSAIPSKMPSSARSHRTGFRHSVSGKTTISNLSRMWQIRSGSLRSFLRRPLAPGFQKLGLRINLLASILEPAGCDSRLPEGAVLKTRRLAQSDNRNWGEKRHRYRPASPAAPGNDIRQRFVPASSSSTASPIFSISVSKANA